MVSYTRIQKNLTVTLTATIPDSRQLVINLPQDTPTGEAEVSINIPLAESAPPIAESGEITREELRARLRAGGLLVELSEPDIGDVLDDEELWALGDQLPPGPSVDEIMKEIRGEY